MKAFKIKVLSFVNLVNGKEVTCFDTDLTPEKDRQKGKDYYDMVRTCADIKTGLISSGVFEDAFREALEADKDVLYFSLSKNISGNYNSARIAAQNPFFNPVNNFQLHPPLLSQPIPSPKADCTVHGNTLWAVRASFEIRRLRRLSRGSADPRES